MSNQINLVSHKKKKLWNRELFLHILEFASRIAIVLLIVSSIGIFFLNRSENLPLLVQKDKIVTSNLSFLQQKIIKILLIRERLQNLDPLVNKGTNIDVILSTISSALPAGVTVGSFKLDDKKITLTVTSPSLAALGNFLDFFVDKVNQKILFKKLTISNFSADPISSAYSLTMDLEYYE